MEWLYHILTWGSPVGIALFFFFSASGVGVLFWGLSRFNESSKDDRGDRTSPARKL